MVLCAIETLQIENPQLAECLAKQYRAGRICLGFAKTLPANASINDDGSRECGEEPLNLYKFPCGYVNLYDPAFVSMLNSMAHEALHAIQQGYQGGPTTTQEELAHKLLIHQCNELEASEAEIARLSTLRDALLPLETGGTLPPDVGGIPGRIGGSILNDPELDTRAKVQAAAGKLRGALGDDLVNARATALCRAAYKRALEIYLQGGPNRPQVYNDAIRATGWFNQEEIRNIPGFGSFQITYTAGGAQFVDGPAGPETRLLGDGVFSQFGEDGHEEKLTIPEVEFISTGFLYPNGSSVLLGGTAPNGMGLVFQVRDPDGDGYFNANTLTQVFQDVALGGGLRFVWNPDTSLLLGVNRSTGDIFSFGQIPAIGDDPPHLFMPMGSMGLRRDLLEFWISPSGTTVFGAPEIGSPIEPGDEYATSTFNQTLGVFVPSIPYYPFEGAIFRPALLELPMASRFVRASGPASRMLNLWGWEQGAVDPMLLASGMPGPSGSLVFQLPMPLHSGMRLRVVSDAAPGVPSVVREVSPPPPLDLDLINRSTQPAAHAFSLRLYGQPFQRGRVQRSQDLKTWGDYSMVRLGAFGDEIVGIDTPPGDGLGFFAFQTQDEAPPAAAADAFTVAPGLAFSGSVLGNDLAPPGTRVILDTAPSLHADLFQWSGDGEFKITPLRASGSITFTYHLETITGSVSAPATVTITLQRSLLSTGLMVQPGPPDYVPVPCLIYPKPGVSPEPLGYYPLYQFRLTNNPMDTCKEPHWHALTPVFFLLTIETDSTGRTDPDSPSCGFGRDREVIKITINFAASDWTAFLAAHPPPLN